jgi:hypothetical protein
MSIVNVTKRCALSFSAEPMPEGIAIQPSAFSHQH